MDLLFQAYLVLDAFLIFFFRLPGHALAGFFLGISVLAILCLLLGELTLGLIYLTNAGYYQDMQNRMVKNHNLSIKSILHREKAHYKTFNREANEYFGKVFFSQAALFATSLWPLPFALWWLGMRFNNVGIIELPFTVPLLGDALGYAFFFIPLYIIYRILFSRFKERLPFFSMVARRMQENAETDEEMMSWSDLHDQAKSQETRPGETNP
jgi:hypothetical protein